MKFHNYVKEFRQKYFKDSLKFSRILGVEQSLWRKVERGINPPPKKTLLKKFALLTHMMQYEEAQMYELARRWKPSEDTYSANHVLLNQNSTPSWREKIIQENTPDYDHKYWGRKS